jgi:hypothetical protein
VGVFKHTPPNLITSVRYVLIALSKSLGIKAHINDYINKYSSRAKLLKNLKPLLRIEIGTNNKSTKEYSDMDYKGDLDLEAQMFLEKFTQAYYGNNWKKAKQIGLSTKVVNEINRLSRRDVATKDFNKVEKNKDLILDNYFFSKLEDEVSKKEEEFLPICTNCEIQVDSFRIKCDKFYKCYKIEYKCHGVLTSVPLCTFDEIKNGITKEEILARLPKSVIFKEKKLKIH